MKAPTPEMHHFFCTRCGRDDRFQKIGQRHYHEGKLCTGRVERVRYVLGELLDDWQYAAEQRETRAVKAESRLDALRERLQSEVDILHAYIDSRPPPGLAKLAGEIAKPLEAILSPEEKP